MQFKWILVAVGVLLGVISAQAEEKTFAKPKAGPYRIDWCLKWSAACGKPAADQFCKSQGYATSNDFDIAENIGALNPPIATIVQSTGQVCNDPQCDGFAQITCVKLDPPPQPKPPPPPPDDVELKTFPYPKHHGKLLDFCMNSGMGGAGCGKPVADQFCELKGFDDATNFFPTQAVAPMSTRSIATGQPCFGPVCRGFKRITCER